MDKVPFVDLYAQYVSIKDDIDNAIEETIKNTSFIGGVPVKKFETSFAELLGIKHVIGCANGTDSIEMILRAYNIGKGDEIIVPAISWISTSEAVSSVGATPVFVDIEPDYYTLNPELLEKAITNNTKVIIPVHLYGQPADMPRIMDIAEKKGLLVIEDCAQSHMAVMNEKLIGTWGHAASFSFYPGKNLGAYGDAGAVATNDDMIAEKIRMIANHGQQGKHNHIMEGRNSRLDGLHAAILSAKLPYLRSWTQARIDNAALYNEHISMADVILPLTRSGAQHVFHLYVVRSKRRNDLQNWLKEKNIETAIHYPVALPYLPAYKNFNYKLSDFPVAAQIQHEILSLPMYPELTSEMISYVADAIKLFCNEQIEKSTNLHVSTK